MKINIRRAIYGRRMGATGVVMPLRRGNLKVNVFLGISMTECVLAMSFVAVGRPKLEARIIKEAQYPAGKRQYRREEIISRGVACEPSSRPSMVATLTRNRAVKSIMKVSIHQARDE